MTGDKYLALLEEDISARIAEANAPEEIYFMHDGCPAHNYGLATAFLRDAFPADHVIGTHELVWPWPPRSPDLNKCDFFLWGHLKSTIYRTAPFANTNMLRAAIEQCCAALTAEQLTRVTDEMRDQLEYCVAAEGGLFEHYL